MIGSGLVKKVSLHLKYLRLKTNTKAQIKKDLLVVQNILKEIFEDI